MNISRRIVLIKLLGKEQKSKKSKKGEYAIEVQLSDESVYTVYRSKKKIASFNHKLINQFPVEAGFFNEREKIIPDCPFKKTPFGIRQTTSDGEIIGKLLHTYLKGLSALPPKLIKCEIVLKFFALWATDMEINDEKKRKKAKLPKRQQSLGMSDYSTISKPIQLKTYVTVADYNGQRFRFKKDMVVQVIQKDPKGWWLVDIHGEIGWAPAAYLVLRDDDGAKQELEENEALIIQDKVGARYISVCGYKATRDDEISFMNGSIVRVVRKYIDGWWLVRYNGREGFVPGSMFRKFDKRQATTYVKNIRRKYSQRRSTIIRTKVNQQNGGSGLDIESPSIVVYECMSAFIGRSEKFEISMSQGDIVTVIEVKDNGWWYVRDWHGRSGWAPATYLRDIHKPLVYQGNKIGAQCVVVSSFDSESESELTIKEGDLVTVVVESDDGWWLVRKNDDPEQEGLVPSVCLLDKDKSPISTSPIQNDNLGLTDSGEHRDNTNDAEEGTDDELEGSNDWVDTNSKDEDFRDCYIVTGDYRRQSFDEIDILEGEIAYVVDQSDKDMWYVEIDGKEGWVPSNILKPISEDELNNSSAPSEATPSPVIEDVAEQQEDSPHMQSPVTLQENITSLLSSESDDLSSTMEPIATHRLCVVSGSLSESGDSGSENDDEQNIEEIEKALAEAERVAKEANERAATLRTKVEKKKSLDKSISDSSSKHKMLRKQSLIEHLV